MQESCATGINGEFPIGVKVAVPKPLNPTSHPRQPTRLTRIVLENSDFFIGGWRKKELEEASGRYTFEISLEISVADLTADSSSGMPGIA